MLGVRLAFVGGFEEGVGPGGVEFRQGLRQLVCVSELTVVVRTGVGVIEDDRQLEED
jgi:hypothetical protein